MQFQVGVDFRELLYGTTTFTNVSRAFVEKEVKCVSTVEGASIACYESTSTKRHHGP